MRMTYEEHVWRKRIFRRVKWRKGRRKARDNVFSTSLTYLGRLDGREEKGKFSSI